MARIHRRTIYLKKKKNLNDPDNHSGVVTHLESDAMECKVKWALAAL